MLCDKRYNGGSSENYNWTFKQPWNSFIPDAKQDLEKVIVSFKQNLRVINKTVNYHEKIADQKKELTKQTLGSNWAVRKPLHKDTVSGRISLRKIKTVSLSSAFDEPENIKEKSLKKYIKNLAANGFDKKQLAKHFKETNHQFESNDISKVDIYYWDRGNVASRTALDTSFTKARIESSIADTGIQKILMKHLEQNQNNPELAFSPEGIEEMNKNIVLLNGGKFHQPILKVRTYETKGNKFAVGQTGNKIHKYVEAAKGTNLFFAIYQNENGKRSFETIPLNIVVERQKQGLSPVPEKDEQGNKLLFHLSPNDLVHIPNEEILATAINDVAFVKETPERIYRFVSCTGGEGHFVHNNYSVGIISNEQGTNNKSERMLDYKHTPALLDEKGKPQMIKNICFKIVADRIGTIKSVIR